MVDKKGKLLGREKSWRAPAEGRVLPKNEGSKGANVVNVLRPHGPINSSWGKSLKAEGEIQGGILPKIFSEKTFLNGAEECDTFSQI